jgi:heat shock protein HslJ
MSTKMACPELAAEQRFFELLGQMDHAEQAGALLTLTGAGHVMEFSSPP